MTGKKTPADDPTPSQLEKMAAHFRLLGEPTRLRILYALGPRPMTVNEIVEATGATQPNISRHLSLMALAGIISRQKEGQFVYYRLTHPLTLTLCQLIHTKLLNEGR